MKARPLPSDTVPGCSHCLQNFLTAQRRRGRSLPLSSFYDARNSLGSPLNPGTRRSFQARPTAQHMTLELTGSRVLTGVSLELLQRNNDKNLFYHEETGEQRNLAKRRGRAKARGASHTPVCCRSRKRALLELP